MRALNVTTFAENLRAKQWPAYQMVFFATATTIQRLKNSSANNENTVKSNSFCVVDLEIVVFREGNCQVNRKFQAKPTLLERFYAEIKNKHG